MRTQLRLRVRPAFPVGPPTWPGDVARPPVEPRTGVDYDTAWSRRYPARLARALVVDGVLRPAMQLLAGPVVHGLDRLDDLDEPAIFAANHRSHLDTPVLLTSLPNRWRHRVAVAAGADYFFDTRAKGAVAALTLGAVPIERTRVSRRSTDQVAALLDEGWSLVVFPEGGRSPDGWGQTFRAGAAYLSLRCGHPVVPVHLEGTRRILRPGATRPALSGGPVHVTFGTPMRAGDDEDVRSLSARIERAVAALADEQANDWWTARRRAAAGATPALTGPDASGWRRTWALGDGRRGGRRRRAPWPS